jgi:LysR family glycine cleavage system transcriptional activator
MTTPVYLNALRAFEASARHQSFSAAAAELNVTPAAVSQLVRGLEEWLGLPLFHRSKNKQARLQLTTAAERALPDIQAGFDRLVSGMEKLKAGAVNSVLTVTLSPAFAAKWLLPRIDKFQLLHPETDVRLDTHLKTVDFVTQHIDIGVRYGAGVWTGLISEKLMDEEVYPVCSPSFIQKHGPIETLDALIDHTLIHDLSMDADAGFPTWKKWLQSCGVQDIDTTRGLRINNSAAVLQTVIEGHGIALARSVMAADDLSAGRIVRLFSGVTFNSPLAYYVVYRSEGADIPRIMNFKDWLIAESGSRLS